MSKKTSSPKPAAKPAPAPTRPIPTVQPASEKVHKYSHDHGTGYIKTVMPPADSCAKKDSK